MRTVILCFGVVAGWALAQDAPARTSPEKAVRDIRDVQIGMSHDHVLAGLGDKYDLERIDDPKSQAAQDGVEFWMVWPKDDPKNPLERESGAIRFWQGKATNIEIDLYPSMSGESARFAERLFWLIYNRADPPASPNRLCGVELRIGMRKDEAISELGKNCKVQPMGKSSAAWCVSSAFTCSHTIWFEGETLSAVKPDKFYTDFSPRWVNLPVELRDFHDGKREEMKIGFTLGGEDFSITIRKRPGQPDSVDLKQHILNADHR
jgi:hypothetical protein